ncbi:MAG: SUF system Fe-S cluster assembly regulator [Pseudomonadales bacterium]|nr:SUF system Fe-S cluster assembly regulator [Pseudomonadales bacterium]
MLRGQTCRKLQMLPGQSDRAKLEGQLVQKRISLREVRLKYSAMKINTNLVFFRGAHCRSPVSGAHCMLRISKMTDYALVIMNRLAKSPAQQLRMEELAEATQLGLPTVRKLMRQLVASGLVRSERGAKGGYQLARLPQMISIAQVVSAVEGPLAITECCDDDGGCELSNGCEVAYHMPTINELIAQILSNISLTDMVGLGAGVHHNVQTILSRLTDRGSHTAP